MVQNGIDSSTGTIMDVIRTDPATGARTGTVRTAHGVFETPAFMPVGTQGTVKALTPADLRSCGAQIILSNTYHLYLRPGEGLIKQLGGLHSFMGWDGPILTDSGGYQVFSLSGLTKVKEDGVRFQSHWDGSYHEFTPEKAVQIQHDLGVDIMMCFDECTPYPCGHDAAARSADLSLGWARRCLRAWRERGADASSSLFGICQGGIYEDLRIRNARALVDMDFPGYAVGGLAVGEPKDDMYRVLDAVLPLLPADRPRYLMGLGTPADLVKCVALGVDMFDCVIPTRNGRNGTVYTPDGKIVIKNARYRDDEAPLDENCGCYACTNFSRAYLRHLFVSNEMLGPQLATLHNIRFFQDLMGTMRRTIADGTFPSWKEDFLKRYRTE